ncbi:MAG: hypothetical protein ACI8PZ_005097 [Myxococcota bacterium]|jgi:hypothetical protein
MRWAVLVLLLACAGETPNRTPASAPTAAPMVDPGRVGMRRLNSREYDATVQALLGTERRPSTGFPADGTAYGYDTVAEALTTSPVLVEAWDRAAGELATEWAGVSTDTVLRTEGEGPGPTWTSGAPFEDRAWRLDGPGELSLVQAVPAGGTWQIAIDAWSAAPRRLTVSVDGRSVGVPTVQTPEPAQSHVVTAALTAGVHTVTLGLDAGHVSIDAITLSQLSPDRPAVDPIGCDDPRCTEAALSDLLARAWRRPVTADELAPFVALVEAGQAADLAYPEAFGVALHAVLLSPAFLYRLELDPSPDAASARPLTDWELAARLSYLLWSGPPDDALRAHAAAGTLREVLPAEVGRMLADDRSQALVDGLIAPWLALDRLPWASPDPTLHPTWDEAVRASLDTELRLFAGDIVLGGRSLLDLFSSPQTWADDRLAAHYGWASPGAGGFVPVVGDRRGLFGKGAITAALAHPDRSAPVQRGAWVLSSLLCRPPPPPPPDVPSFGVDDSVSGSVREQLEAHRSDPACAACHATMDPLGFALEHYGPDGRWREVDALGSPVDPTGELLDGTVVDSAEALSAHLAADPDVPRCMAQQVFTYALGRSPRVEDQPSLDRITAAFVAGDHRFDALVLALVTDPVFQERVPWAE